MTTIRSIAQRGFPYFVVVPFILTVLTPDTLNPAVVTVSGLLLGGVLCHRRNGATAARVKGECSGRRPDACDGLVVRARVGVAPNPRVALLGLVGLHTAAALWVLAAVWVSAGLLCADARALRETLFAIALTGPFFVAAQVYGIYVRPWAPRWRARLCRRVLRELELRWRDACRGDAGVHSLRARESRQGDATHSGGRRDHLGVGLYMSLSRTGLRAFWRQSHSRV